MIEILRPGLSTTVQDVRARHGRAELGINVGGALDHYSAVAANLLVGNEPEAALLEAAYLPPTFVARTATTIAVTGGSAEVRVDGTVFDTWTSVRLRPGDVVELGPSRDAPRTYIAFRGGIDVPTVHGSRSTNLLGRLGGLGGAALTAGARLPLGPATDEASDLVLPAQWRLATRRTGVLRVVPVAPDERLSARGLDTFFGTDWTVTPAGDRTGVRFSGPTLEWRTRPQPFGAGPDLSNVVDAAYPLGSIHVPGGAGPILLHRDGPTMGGYAVVGVVARADLDMAAQYMPQSSIRFARVSRAEALDAWERHRADVAKLAERLQSKARA